jgi:hypothetical protein
LRPRTVTILAPGLRNRAAVSSRCHQAAGILAQIEHQTLQIAAAKLLDGVPDEPAGLFIEAGNAQVADAGLQ